MLSFKTSNSKKIETLVRESIQREGQLELVQSVINKIQEQNWSAALKELNETEQTSITRGLIELSISLQNFRKQEEASNWINNGLLQIGKVINTHQNNLDTLAHELVHTVVKYTNANQGGLFIKKENDDGKPVLILLGCYAYNKKKYIDRLIDLNEGLVGQCFKEGETIYMTNLPSDYVKITSGLGEALPRNLIIVPLKSKERVGVLELAYFTKLQPFEIKFIESATEIIANAISNTIDQEKTFGLLEQSEKMAQDLKRNEEEMRQNMEEMQSIQEDLNRKNMDLQTTSELVETMRMRESELINSKLNTQQIIHDKITKTLRSKIEMLQQELKMERQGELVAQPS